MKDRGGWGGEHEWTFEGEMQPHGPYGGPRAGGKKFIVGKCSWLNMVEPFECKYFEFLFQQMKTFNHKMVFG
jgi:hypothetical protein